MLWTSVRKAIENDFFNQLLMVIAIYIQYCNYVKMFSAQTRMWTREMFSQNERDMNSFYNKIFEIMRNRDNDQFRQATRMGVPQFKLLYNLLKERLIRVSHRRPIEAECRLVLTLVYLSQGVSWRTLSWAFRIGYSTVREIILDTCEDIWQELHGIYLAPPNEHEWEKISLDFYASTGLPNCVGALDGKHVRIKCPPNGNSVYYNYKQYHSIVLLACCDSNYCFTAVDIGAYGSQSDGGVLAKSVFGTNLLNGTLNLPKPKIIPNSNIALPFYFVGDSAFPLKTHLMRPYPGRNLISKKETFNKILSSARVSIENTFGVMTARWRVLENSINLFPENAEKIIKAVVVLHNFVKMNDGQYCPPNYTDNQRDNIEGLWRKTANPLPKTRMFTRFNATRSAFQQRDTLRDYLTHT